MNWEQRVAVRRALVEAASRHSAVREQVKEALATFDEGTDWTEAPDYVAVCCCDLDEDACPVHNGPKRTIEVVVSLTVKDNHEAYAVEAVNEAMADWVGDNDRFEFDVKLKE